MTKEKIQTSEIPNTEALKDSETHYRRLFETAQDGILILDGITGVITDVNPFLLKMLGYTHREILGKQFWEIGLFRDIGASKNAFLELKQNKYVHYQDLPLKSKDGRLRDVEFVGNVYQVNHKQVIQCNIWDITERKKAENAKLESEGKFHSLIDQSSDGIIIIDEKGIILEWNQSQEQISGLTSVEVLGRPMWEIQFQMMSDELKSPTMLKKLEKDIRSFLLSGKSDQLNEYVEMTVQHSDGKRRKLQVSFFRFKTENSFMAGSISRDITECKQRERELESIVTVSAALRMAHTLDEMLPSLLNETLDVMNATQGAIWLYDPIKDELRTVLTRGWDYTGTHSIPPEKPGEGINGLVFATGKPYVSREIHLDMHLPEIVRQWTPPGVGGVTVPIRSEDRLIGTFNVNVTLPREITPDEIRLLTTLSEIAGNAIQRTRSYEKTQRDVRRFAALHSIDVSINSNDNLDKTLNLLLEQVIDLLNVSAADILLFNPYTLTLEYSAGKGFRSRAIEKSQLRLGEGYAGRAALQRRIFNSADLRAVGSEYSRKELLAHEEFVTYFGVPLITKGKVIGVLDIFNRSSFLPDSEWLEFMEALASQAAIAIDNATLFDDLQRSNINLLQAYDTTIEGWSKALDLRDHETEGHTQRVTELTMQLARAYGLKDEEIVHVRRGALLHDIGKMGIPDEILLKPGPLTEEEWVIMRQHPRYAFEMLSPIEYLRPALDIPYCHHEKWDGTGYPRGLKGEQIPMTARLFAVVDVWDALRSDRPYRRAWREEKVFEHIKSLSGTHFDPKVAELFLNMMGLNR